MKFQNFHLNHSREIFSTRIDHKMLLNALLIEKYANTNPKVTHSMKINFCLLPEHSSYTNVYTNLSLLLVAF